MAFEYFTTTSSRCEIYAEREPLISIVCITYNQERFIQQALDSFIRQMTNFNFVCLISDDCSTDGTALIIREYENKYPDKIKAVYHTKNIGAMENLIYGLSRIHSKYAIINEGDDYFTDSYKLQKQVDFLEEHPECTICFHPVEVVFENGNNKSLRPREYFPSSGYRFNKSLLTLEDLLRHNFIQTNSAMYRWRFTDMNISEIFPRDILPGDWYIHLLHAQNGNIGFINEIMSVYRRHPGGIWWVDINNPEQLHLKNGIAEINFYHQVYKNIASSSEIYLTSTVIPCFSYFINIFVKYQRTAEIKAICAKFPDYISFLLIQLIRQLQEQENSVSYRLVNKIMSNRIARMCYLFLKKIVKTIIFRIKR
jgi:glycosyltransferase involved in cell wall biosynthesis